MLNVSKSSPQLQQLSKFTENKTCTQRYCDSQINSQELLIHLYSISRHTEIVEGLKEAVRAEMLDNRFGQ